MLSRERVAAVIRHEKFDRMPIYSWVRANLEKPIAEAFGSVEAFEDHYEFDMAHLFGGPVPHWKELDEMRERLGRDIEPGEYLDVPLRDPNDEAMFDNLKKQIGHHQTDRGRFVYVQTPGIFECLNGVFGIENHLGYLLMYPEELHRVYRRQAEWNRTFAMNCLDLGVDMVHVSDDWGAQNGLMFSPETWREMIRPYHKITCDSVRGRGAFLSLHCDGNASSVVDGIIELGYQVVHPWQESAGMSLDKFRAEYRSRLTVHGGLDIQDTLGFGDLDKVRAAIERVVTMFADGGLLFNTTHFVQDHCSIEELRFAYDLVYRLVRERTGENAK
jgi:uroporphyrinogen decarboxylase